MVHINFLAVLAATASNVVIGFLWYGPLFGKPWAALSGFTEETMVAAKAKGMGKNYALMMLGAFLTAFVLAHALVFASAYTNTHGIPAGLMCGFWNWLGFIVPLSMGSVLWDGKPWKLFLINVGYQLVALLAMGCILAVWT